MQNLSRIASYSAIALAVLPVAPALASEGLLAQPSILGIPAGPKDGLKQAGINLSVYYTEFYQGLVSGEGERVGRSAARRTCWPVSMATVWVCGRASPSPPMRSSSMARTRCSRATARCSPSTPRSGNPNPFGWSGFIGLGGSNLIASRPDDKFGISYFYYGFSQDLKDGFVMVNYPLNNESGVEAFYNAAITAWFNLSADAQVISPADGDETSVFLGLRAQVKVF